MQHQALTERIIGCAMKVHNELGFGFLESVYHQALAHELRKAALSFQSEYPLQVSYDQVIVGVFSADLFVENTVLVEIKAVQTLATPHEVQLVNYLTATGIDVGLLINFGSVRLDFKRKHRIYQPVANADH